MRFTKTKSRLFVLCAGCWGLAGIASANTLPPVWFQATGPAITSWNDVADGVGFYTLPTFPFQFNFLGVNYTSATLSSNGSIYFSPQSTAPPTTPQPQASPSLFTQGAWPRIAPAWYDIQDIDGSGSVFVNMLANRVVITFQDVGSYVPVPPSGVVPSDVATFQVSLDSDGSVIFAYQAFNSVGPGNSLVGSQQAIVGITSGMGAADPGSVNLSFPATSPGFYYLSTGSTVYQAVMNNPTPDNSQFAGLDLVFTPVGLQWAVTSYAAGVPTPEPSSLIEILIEIMLSAVTLLIWRSRPSVRIRRRV